MAADKVFTAVLTCLAVFGMWSAHASAGQNPRAAALRQGTLNIVVSDDEAKCLPCRIRLVDSQGKSVGAPNLPFWRDHFVCEGNVTLTLPEGRCSLEIERGPEYQRLRRTVTIHPGKTTSVKTVLQRIAHLAAEGWYSGELHIHRKLEHMQLLMRAEDIQVAPVITWWNTRNLWATQELPSNPLIDVGPQRFMHVLAGEDEREGGALLYFGLRRPLQISGSTREYPSPLKYVEQARRQPGIWIDIEKPFWWGRPDLARQRSSGFHRSGKQPHVSQQHVRKRSLGQAAGCKPLSCTTR